MKILIIGGDGFVGKSFKEYYHGCHEIVYGTRRVGLYDKNAVFLDVTDGKMVREVIRDIRPDAIINLSAINSIAKANENPQLTMAVNVDGSRNILNAVKDTAKETKVVLIGSSEIYEMSDCPLSENSALGPRNVYGESKLKQEEMGIEYTEKYGLNVLIIRAFNHAGIYQNENSMIANFCNQVARIDAGISREKTIHCGNLHVKRDISDVRDVINAYIALAESEKIKSGIYNVCSGVATSVGDILNYIIGFSEKEIRVEIDPERIRCDEPPLILGDCSKINIDAGFKNQYCLKDTLHLMYNYYRGVVNEKI